MKIIEILPLIYEIHRLGSQSKDVSQHVTELRNKCAANPDLLEKVNLFLQYYSKDSSQETKPINHNNEEKLSADLQQQINAYKKLSFMNNDHYNILLSIAEICYVEERNGIPHEHAFKLSALFGKVDEALHYLETFQKLAVRTKGKNIQVMHDACAFRLPKVPFKEFESWCKLAKSNLDNLWNKNFLNALANADAITSLIVSTNRGAKKNKSSETKILKTQLTKELALKKNKFKNLNRRKKTLTPDEIKEHRELGLAITDINIALSKAYAGTPLSQISLLMVLAYYERYKTEQSGTYKYFLDQGLTAKDYALFTRLDRAKAGVNMPDLILSLPESPQYYIKKLQVQNSEEAAIAACLGKITGCCQSLSGEAGQRCVIHLLTSPNGCAYVICKGDSKNPQPSDVILAQSWAWKSKKGAIVFDSMEFKNYQDEYIALYHELAHEMVTNHNIARVLLGQGGRTPQTLLSVVSDNEASIEPVNYSDARIQLLVDHQLHPLDYCFSATDFASTKKLAVFESWISKYGNEELINIPGLTDWIKLRLNKYEDIKLSQLQAGCTPFPKLKDQVDLLIAQEYAKLACAIERDVDLNYLKKCYALGADSNSTDYAGNNIVIKAVVKKSLELLTLAIEAKADVNCENSDERVPLFIAYKNLDIAAIKMLITANADLTMRSKNERRTLWQLALEHRQIDIIRLLLSVDNINQKLEGASSFIYAVRKGEWEIANLLIEYQADLGGKDVYEESALTYALVNKRTDLSKLLIGRQVEINTPCSNGITPLMLVSREGNLELFKLLIAANVDIYSRNKEGLNAFLLAARSGQIEIMEELLKLDSALIHSTSTSRKKPPIQLIMEEMVENKKHLSEVKLSKLIDTIKYLLKLGATFTFVRDASSREINPLDLAVQSNNANLLKLLIDAKYDIQQPLNNEPILLYAIRKKSPLIIDYLLEISVDIESQNAKNTTGIILAASFDDMATVTKLVDKGANFQKVNVDNRSALTVALEFKHWDIALYLIDRGATLVDQNVSAFLNEAPDNVKSRLAKPNINRTALFKPVENSIQNSTHISENTSPQAKKS